MTMPKRKRSATQDKPTGITRITVSGYKSLAEETSIEIRPLTILAGANSSGKSSIMQPLLLMKQTLEATYDPGPLLLNGPNVKFTSGLQLLPTLPGRESIDEMDISLGLAEGLRLTDAFRYEHGNSFYIAGTTYERGRSVVVVRPDMPQSEALWAMRGPVARRWAEYLAQHRQAARVYRTRCFLELHLVSPEHDGPDGWRLFVPRAGLLNLPLAYAAGRAIRSTVHLPGLRGNPERAYKVTAVGPSFPGTFENYVASVVLHWQGMVDGRADDLCRNLATLGLTWRVEAKRADDAQVELLVGRLPGPAKEGDLVNIADVGFGVAQVLPVLVALLAAEPGRLVYIEQPELHLHPKAQVALAGVLADAANRGVRVVAETHSALLLLELQALVARGELAPDKAILHWFTRGEDGVTKVDTAELDEAGAFGDWPEDFGTVELQAQRRYLEAAEARLGLR